MAKEQPQVEATGVDAEPLVQDGGNSFVSFDELESANNVQTQPNVDDVKEEVTDAVKETIKEELKDKLEKAEEAADAEEPDEKGEVAEESSEELPEAKTWEGINGKDQVNVRADAKFKVKVNKQDVDVTFDELVSNYSGKTDWTRKYNELNTEKQKFEKDSSILQNYVDDLHQKLVVEKDVEGAIGHLAQAMGGNPVNVIQQVRQMMMEKLNQWSELTPEQREVEMAKEEVALWKKHEEQTQQARISAKEQSEMDNRVSEVMTSNNLDQETFLNLYNELNESGLVDTGDLTPELVGEYHQEVQAREALDTMLTEVNPTLEEDAKDEAVEELRKVMTDNGFTVDALRDIAVEVYGNEKAKNISKKLRKSKPANTSRTPAPQGEEPWSWDQLEA